MIHCLFELICLRVDSGFVGVDLGFVGVDSANLGVDSGSIGDDSISGLQKSILCRFHCLLLEVDSGPSEVDSPSTGVNSQPFGVDSISGSKIHRSVFLSVLNRSRLGEFQSRLELVPETSSVPESTRDADFGSDRFQYLTKRL